MFDRVWSCLIRFEGHQTFDQKRKTFLLFACLMGDVLSRVDSRVSNMFDAGMRTRLHSGLYQLFHLCLIIIITLFKSQIILAKHKCSTNWGDCKSNKSNQIDQINQIKSNVGF